MISLYLEHIKKYYERMKQMAYWVYIIIIIIICIILLPYVTSKLLFSPSTEVPFDFLQNEFITPEGISAIFYDAGNNTPIVIYSHGNAGNIFNRRSLYNYLADVPISLILYDYRGFGRSAGEATTNNIIEDGENVYRYITILYPNRKIILWGESMGSAVSWYLASKYEVSGLIITSGYSSLSEVINYVSINGLGTLVSYLMFLPDNIIHAPMVKCPILLLHSVDDTLIPLSQAVKMHNISPINTILVQTSGGHNFNIGNYIRHIIGHINTCVRNS